MREYDRVVLLKQLDRKRRQLGVTQKELAVWAGVSHYAVSKWLTFVRLPDIKIIWRLHEHLRRYSRNGHSGNSRVLRGNCGSTSSENEVSYFCREFRRHHGLATKAAQELGLTISSMSLKLKGKRPLYRHEAEVLVRMLRGECND